MWLGFGLDGALALELGGAFEVERERHLVLAPAFEWVAGDADFDDVALSIGAELDLWRADPLALRAGLAALAARAENAAATLTGFGTELTLAFGRIGSDWTVALEARWAGTWLTRIDHSDWYRRMVHAEARDGWYAATGTSVTVGARAGVAFGPWVVGVTGGWQWTGQWDFLPPVALQLTFAWVDR